MNNSFENEKNAENNKAENQGKSERSFDNKIASIIESLKENLSNKNTPRDNNNTLDSNHSPTQNYR
jgi:hypothetical protein